VLVLVLFANVAKIFCFFVLSIFLSIPAFLVPGFTDCSFSRSWFYRLPLFAFLVLQIPALRVPGFTDSGFSRSRFYRFRLFAFRVSQIPAFRVPGFTDSGFSRSGFHRFQLFVVRVLQIPAFHRNIRPNIRSIISMGFSFCSPIPCSLFYRQPWTSHCPPCHPLTSRFDMLLTLCQGPL
jgi:hypothetical protein